MLADDVFRGEADSEGDSDGHKDEHRTLSPREPEIGAHAHNHGDERDIGRERTALDR